MAVLTGNRHDTKLVDSGSVVSFPDFVSSLTLSVANTSSRVSMLLTCISANDMLKLSVYTFR